MEQTTPETPGVAGIESALESSFGFSTPEPKPKTAPAPEPAEVSLSEQSDEVTPDDLPSEIEDAPADSAAEAFEITHNGQPVKLSREEMIQNAMQGFDYTRKTQALAEKERQATQRLTKLGELEQLQTALAPDLAEVKAVEAQLKQYEKVDWVQLATDNPLEYPKYRAQFDTLLQSYQRVRGQFEQKANAFGEQKRAMTAQLVEQQRNILLEKLPAWRDSTKFEQGAKEVRDFLTKEGVPAERIDQLNDAVSVSIAYKAAQYDKLQAAKRDKINQLRTSAPVVKPGAVAQQPDAKTEFVKFRKSFKSAGTKGQTRTQEGLLLQKLNSVFKM